MGAASVVVGAMRGKGPANSLSGLRNLLKRAGVICQRYGVTPGKMDRELASLVAVLDEFQCGATLPVTAAVLARNPGVIEKYQQRNVELAVHGYTHVDHTQLPPEEQARRLPEARRVHRARGAAAQGFRCPYLRWNEATLAAVQASGFLYDGSQALAWDVVDGLENATYRHVLGFYGALSARDYPAVPHWDGDLVRIPYCLPDDEALVNRLHLESGEAMNRVWLAILARTYELGELFTLGLHPERILACRGSLVETLRKARSLSPAVWIARLDELANWWIARTRTVVTVSDGERGEIHVSADGPEGIAILVRGVEVLTLAVPWDGAYQRAVGTQVAVRAEWRPFIGVSPTSSSSLSSFLRQQGYIVEPAVGEGRHSLYLDRPAFGPDDERPLLTEIERNARPLVRLGRWPHGARSALCVTGDVDALTVWDYGLRLLGG